MYKYIYFYLFLYLLISVRIVRKHDICNHPKCIYQPLLHGPIGSGA